ncbi:Multidrug resistance protein 1 [Zancudomyces culisetae]|uniref:ABC-type xenobiotic transporter n=1 Tax=Zancudomyces culisetae TaxID=1213189 RepID=A0A1R1PHW1_ZANCU|nr:Multidrug resistance protein 1 [Zancudomyces culisetae]|eukprot:OMH80546.1 Multidrug resistance protein 1 [Zancudomyces culisetae]
MSINEKGVPSRAETVQGSTADSKDMDDQIQHILNSEGKELGGMLVGAHEKKESKEEEEEEKPKGFKGFFKKPKKVKEQKPQIGYFQLFRFATTLDKMMILFGVVGSAGTGVSMPLMTVFFSDIMGSFISYNSLVIEGSKAEADDLLNSEVKKTVKIFGILAAALYVVSYATYLCWNATAAKQAKRMREAYYRAIMSQEIEWFDSVNTGDLTTRMSSDISLIQEGINEKSGFIIQYLTTFFGGFVLAFIRGWKMALVVLAVMPLLIVSAGLMGANIGKLTNMVQEAYAEAGAVATEVLSSMRTVMSFNAQEREIERYSDKLSKGHKVGMKKTMIFALGVGVIFFFIYALYSLGFWYGAKLIRDGEASPSKVLNVFFALMIGGFSLSGAAPSISAIASARGAAPDVFKVIDKKSKIDATDLVNGDSADGIKGEIEFRNSTFKYPTRPKIKVLDNVSLKVKPGQKVAFVGESGCGKSTTIALIQRLYDCLEGSVLIDGKDIREYNVRSLRQNMGLVSQEPVLFGVSIAQNIKWGAKDYENNPPTQADVEEACKGANIHDFIMTLPQKYETLVGERGALLSGGQKQRIAIARALIRNPKILLLDEATSALDTESERLVQDALDKSTVNRTTITIAHRLSTIKDSDMIYVFGKGKIIEGGTHAELVEMDGAYASLVKAQALKKVNGDQAEKKVDTKKEKELTRKMTDAKGKVGEVSASSVDSEDNDEDKKIGTYGDFIWVLKKYSQQTKIFIPAAIVSFLDGGLFPSFSIVFAKMLTAFGNTDMAEQKRETNMYSLLFLAFAVVNYITIGTRMYLFGRGAVKMSVRLKHDMFTQFIKQDSEYFDQKVNGSGALTSRLASEPDDVYKLSSDGLTVLFNAAGSLTAGIIIAFVRSWMLTLVILAVVPIIAFAQSQQHKTMMGGVKQSKSAEEMIAQEASESITNIRVVTSLSRENTFILNYTRNTIIPHKTTIRGFYINGLFYAFSTASLYLVYGLAFFAGAKFVMAEHITTEQMFNAIYAVVFAAVALGQTSGALGMLPKALNSSHKLRKLFGTEPKISIFDELREKSKSILPSELKGDVKAENVTFSYPTRLDVRALKRVNVNADAGQTIALVGSSGSGKSTIINLILRLYDVLEGSISVDSVDVRDWPLDKLRDHPSLVSQEPVLFDCSASENIKYGKPDATEFEVQQAAKAANIHNLLMDLPDGYNTRVGGKGSMLSGGQKQRIAIARALIRNPKILLLDEATSALDTESEKVVQYALDNASVGRTTISVAHRLSTVQNADWIYVFKSGEVIEQGNHESLIGLGGTYASLVKQQSLAIN